MKAIQIPYYQKREAILYMLNHYKENCAKYLKLDFKQSDIDILIEIDSEYVQHYQRELQLLEQTTFN